MSSSIIFISFLILFSYPSLFSCRGTRSLTNIGSKLQTYIIHVERANNVATNSDDDLMRWYRSFLPSVVSDAEDFDRLVYSYTEVFSGFAAKLTKNEVSDMSKKRGFVHAYPSRTLPLLTTHTPNFLNLNTEDGVWKNSNLGKGVIVGVLDTGILPGHPSFNDDGLPPPPPRWKGECVSQRNSECNNKIIGARVSGSKFYPLDTLGHGSHTASTIAGNFVHNVSFLGQAKGTMSGIAPLAHLAIYKVCFRQGCKSEDILAGLDSAVKDGVDVLSLSLGGGSTPYDEDPIAIGSFGAIQKGIPVVCAAGNSGPRLGTLSNEAPWILTVAASTIDRSFRSTLKLGNGKEYSGESLLQPNQFNSSASFQLVDRGQCFDIDISDVKGKIVICDAGPLSDIQTSARHIGVAGGVGIIAVHPEQEGYTLRLNEISLPSSEFSLADSLKIKAYVNSTDRATTSLVFNGTVLGTSPSPVITYFSSRGPSVQSPGILKPDVSAPGMNIIAAWNQNLDSKSNFPVNMISGTSMSAPHVSGVVALIKGLHPDWSPAAIKSAIITSSDYLDRDGNRIKDEQHANASFFVSGAGHVNPSNAAEPGLVYDLSVPDYVAYLCGLLGQKGVSAIVRRSNVSCSDVKNVTDSQLNYPTITVSLGTVTVNRTVTNVGNANASYVVKVDVPKGVSVIVNPKTLQFSKVNQKKSFSVTVTSSKAAQGNLMWVSGKTIVRSALLTMDLLK